jgi:hypothetical protein
MNKIKFFIFVFIVGLLLAFNDVNTPKDTIKVKPAVVIKDSTEYNKLIKKQENLNKSLDDILLERKEQQKKMDQKK